MAVIIHLDVDVEHRLAERQAQKRKLVKLSTLCIGQKSEINQLVAEHTDIEKAIHTFMFPNGFSLNIINGLYSGGSKTVNAREQRSLYSEYGQLLALEENMVAKLYIQCDSVQIISNLA